MPFQGRNSTFGAVFGIMVSRRSAIGIVAVVLAVVCGVAAAAGTPRASRSVVLGKTANYPSSGCPETSRCEVVARVTGVQMNADGTVHPFRAPASGQIVSWWLKLPPLHRAQIRSFSQLFGGPPAARITVLRRGEKGRVRMVRQSATQELREHLGAKGRVRFRLTEPLRVQEGDYIGLTAITWVPAFAVNLDPAGDVWLASRPRSRCRTPSSRDPETFARYYRRTDAHEQSSTVRLYQCQYRTARLLYWARFVPDAEQPQPGDDNGGTQQRR
jgi:hypothetical protein